MFRKRVKPRDATKTLHHPYQINQHSTRQSDLLLTSRLILSQRKEQSRDVLSLARQIQFVQLLSWNHHKPMLFRHMCSNRRSSHMLSSKHLFRQPPRHSCLLSNNKPLLSQLQRRMCLLRNHKRLVSQLQRSSSIISSKRLLSQQRRCMGNRSQRTRTAYMVRYQT